MKRSEHLEPLSHDHYEGLLVQGRIRKGLANDAPAAVIAEYVTTFWDAHLVRHFRHEEEHLVPLRSELEDDGPMDQMLDEHRNIRAQVERVRAGATAESLSKLARMMKAHIRFEERELFPALERHVPETRLREVGSRLRATHAEADLSWEPAFWE